MGTGELCSENPIDGCKFGENITGESSFRFRVEKNGCELRLERYFGADYADIADFCC